MLAENRKVKQRLKKINYYEKKKKICYDGEI